MAPSIPKKYNSELIWRDKCLFVLHNFGPMYLKEVAKKIIEIDTSIDVEIVEARVRSSMYELKNLKAIKAKEKTGRKFLYAL